MLDQFQTQTVKVQLFPPPPTKASKAKKASKNYDASPLPSPPHAVIRNQSTTSDRIGGHDSSLQASLSTRNGNSSTQLAEPVVNSIFPRYNPELALEHQAYYPTCGSPTNIPQEVVSHRQYSPDVTENRSPSGLQSPMIQGVAAPGHFPRGVMGETILEPSTNEELKALWKVTNGWKVSRSEGRSFCLRMESQVDEPVHTLSSATQALYTLRLDPTSTSAQVTLTRQDPSKPPSKGTVPTPTGGTRSNTGIEVLGTTLEERARRLPPNDGLVALLLPIAASKMIVDIAQKNYVACDDGSILAAAERECGRLMWDFDSKKYLLVHPCMATPFHISITSSPAWSRVEYTLEHPKLPRNLVRLTRDGAGTGYMEIDTGVAAKIDCFYIADVAICAVLLVAVEEEKTHKIERFDAPPISPRLDLKEQEKKKGKEEKTKDKSSKMEEFEMDLEAQISPHKPEAAEKEAKVPGVCRLLWMTVKFGVWVVVKIAKGCAACLIGISKCLTRKKK